MTRVGWRIVPADQAQSAFEGEGARRFGGRWNSPGVAVVYASENKALAALEVRVHIDTTRKIKLYRCFSFEFDASLLRELPESSLPKNWRMEPPPPAIQQIGDEWVKSGQSAILAVPSVIIPEEKNLLLNPKHPEFRKIKIHKPTKFAFDVRLL